MAEPIVMPFEGGGSGGGRLAWTQGTVYQMLVRMGATWRIRLNDPFSAATPADTIPLSDLFY